MAKLNTCITTIHSFRINSQVTVAITSDMKCKNSEATSQLTPLSNERLQEATEVKDVVATLSPRTAKEPVSRNSGKSGSGGHTDKLHFLQLPGAVTV